MNLNQLYSILKLTSCHIRLIAEGKYISIYFLYFADLCWLPFNFVFMSNICFWMSFYCQLHCQVMTCDVNQAHLRVPNHQKQIFWTNDTQSILKLISPSKHLLLLQVTFAECWLNLSLWSIRKLCLLILLRYPIINNKKNQIIQMMPEKRKCRALKWYIAEEKDVGKNKTKNQSHNVLTLISLTQWS